MGAASCSVLPSRPRGTGLKGESSVARSIPVSAESDNGGGSVAIERPHDVNLVPSQMEGGNLHGTS